MWLKKHYDTQWHNIKFSEFYQTSILKEVDGKFYNLFYSKFFERYNDFAELDKGWLKHKEKISDILYKYCDTSKNILSVGAGLGYIELLLNKKGIANIDLYEVSDIPFKWIKTYISKDKLYSGDFENFVINSSNNYNLIFLISIEYFFDDKSLIKFLKDLKRIIKENSKIIMISYTFSRYNNIFCELKDYIREIKKKLYYLSKVDFYGDKNKQLLGYIRQDKHLEYIFRLSGFKDVKLNYYNKNELGYSFLLIESIYK